MSVDELRTHINGWGSYLQSDHSQLAPQSDQQNAGFHRKVHTYDGDSNDGDDESGYGTGVRTIAPLFMGNRLRIVAGTEWGSCSNELVASGLTGAIAKNVTSLLAHTTII